jgi:Arc/MetJ-type ribon-helix-helix transcriptional regulator
MPGFGRQERGGVGQDQVMAVDVQLEDHIRKIEGLVGDYLRSPQDEAIRQTLVAELEKLDDQTARAHAHNNIKLLLTRYQLPQRSLLIGATSDVSIGEDVPSPEFQAQVALVKAARNAIRDTTAEAQSALQSANDELAEVRRREAGG